MFYLLVLKDTVRVAPNNFDKTHEHALVDALHCKYANKVLAGHGLCVAVDGFDSKADAVIYANDGGCHVRVQFRLVMFRPFLSEVCVGKVRQSDASGILVSLEFFDHVWIPKDSLLPNTEFNPEVGSWVWSVESADSDPAQLLIDVGEEVMFRVVGIEFGKRPLPGHNPATDEKVTCLADLKPPMRVIGTMAEDGLGVTAWWKDPEPDAAVVEDANAAAAADGADAASAAAAADEAAPAAVVTADGTAPAAAAAAVVAVAAADSAALVAAAVVDGPADVSLAHDVGYADGAGAPPGAGALLDPSAVPADAAAAMVDDLPAQAPG